MQSKAKTVNEYLKALPADWRKAISTVRKTILKSLPKGYKEIMQYGMIGYVVPLKLFPQGYLGDKTIPLPYAGLASQKNHMSVYLMGVYSEKSDKWFRELYKKSGKKLDMGRSCVRFKKLENLPLDVIGKAIARTSVKSFIKSYKQSRSNKK